MNDFRWEIKQGCIAVPSPTTGSWTEWSAAWLLLLWPQRTIVNVAVSVLSLLNCDDWHLLIGCLGRGRILENIQLVKLSKSRALNECVSVVRLWSIIFKLQGNAVQWAQEAQSSIAYAKENRHWFLQIVIKGDRFDREGEKKKQLSAELSINLI